MEIQINKKELSPTMLNLFIKLDIYNSLYAESKGMFIGDIDMYIDNGVKNPNIPQSCYISLDSYIRALDVLKFSILFNNFILDEEKIKFYHKLLTENEWINNEIKVYRKDNILANNEFSYINKDLTADVSSQIRHLIKSINAKKEGLDLKDICTFISDFNSIYPFKYGNERIRHFLFNFLLLGNGFPYLIIPYNLHNKYLIALASEKVIAGSLSTFIIERLILTNKYTSGKISKYQFLSEVLI